MLGCDDAKYEATDTSQQTEMTLPKMSATCGAEPSHWDLPRHSGAQHPDAMGKSLIVYEQSWSLLSRHLYLRR